MDLPYKEDGDGSSPFAPIKVPPEMGVFFVSMISGYFHEMIAM